MRPVTSGTRRASARKRFGKAEFMSVEASDFLKHQNSLIDNVGSDAVAFNQSYIIF
jgi:hypothetical protein